MLELGACHCRQRQRAMERGELAQDRWGHWKWPINQVDAAFRLPLPRYNWPFCPWCGGALPAGDSPTSAAVPYEPTEDG